MFYSHGMALYLLLPFSTFVVGIFLKDASHAKLDHAHHNELR
jgi:hypothetical protein